MPRVSHHRMAPREFREALGERIRYYRIARGISQTQFAALLHTSQSAYSRLESGGCDCSIPRLHFIAEQLNIKLSVLLEGLL